jgi:preprotein translocase subunit SecY
MRWKIKNLHVFLKLTSAIILLVGLGSAIYIYQTAEDDLSGVLGYEIVGGSVYPVMPQDSKIYRHDLELYGGKAAVLADELSRWIAGLWHGKPFAYTVAFITLIISFGFFFAANHLPSRLKSDVPNNTRDGTD